MSNDAGTDLLVGALLPLLIAVINQSRWSAKVKGIVALLMCVCVATVMSALRGADWHDWRNTVLIITGAAVGFYHTFWKPSTIAPQVETDTSPTP